MNVFKLTEKLEIHKLSNEIVVMENGNKKSIKVENQLMRILLLLVKHDGELVEKETFIREIWDGNNFVGEQALTKNIFKLRELLKKNNIEKDIRIETIPKKGYRLIVSAKNLTIKKKSNLKYAYIAAILILLAVIGFYSLKEDHPINKDQVITVDEKDKDTIIFLDGSEGVQVIEIEPTTTKFIKLDDLK
jgi:DNA-binding winged helix-turn-helix (wHTH) protein